VEKSQAKLHFPKLSYVDSWHSTGPQVSTFCFNHHFLYREADTVAQGRLDFQPFLASVDARYEEAICDGKGPLVLNTQDG